ncbi:MAG: TOBE domain-containing protein, partial [Roseovarius sp.]
DMGLRVNVGVRPEDLTLTTAETYLYDGTVDFVEALGEVTLLYFEAEHGRDPVLAKLPGIHASLRGESVRLTADPDKVHVFSNGRSLRYRDG